MYNLGILAINSPFLKFFVFKHLNFKVSDPLIRLLDPKRCTVQLQILFDDLIPGYQIYLQLLRDSGSAPS